MHISVVALHLAGAVVLLLWAVRMVRTGVERGFGPQLRRVVGSAKSGRLPAAGAGVAAAVLLQGSTAVAILASGLAASGIIAPALGLALLLGADLGSALVVQILTFDLSLLVPVLIIGGGLLFLKSEGRIQKQVGRITLGIALVIISLQMASEATAPLRESSFLPMVMAYLRGDFFTAFVIGALFTWAIHSSVASVLMVITMAAHGVAPPEVAASLIFGANLGSGIIAFWLTRGQPSPARRLPAGNLMIRGAAAVACLLAVQAFGLPQVPFSVGPGQEAAFIHVGFNALVLVAGLLLTGPVAALAERLLPDPAAAAEPGDMLAHRKSALDVTVIDQPGLAHASATRELLRMGEIIEIMLRPFIDMLEGGDRDSIRALQKLDDEVNRAQAEIKLYLARANRGQLNPEEQRRGTELIDTAINMERAGDIVAKNLLVRALKLRGENMSLSKEGLAEITDLHARVMANMQLALNVLVSGDLDSARQLVREKDRMREMERKSHERHLQRLRSGTVESIQTSNIHLEVVRALKEINTLFVTIAYPMLQESGELLESRLAASAR